MICMSGKREFETWIFIKMKKFFGLHLNLKSLSITLNPHFYIYTKCKVQVGWCRYRCVCRPVDVTWMQGPPPCVPGSETGSCFCRRTSRLLFPSLQKHLARTKTNQCGASEPHRGTLWHFQVSCAAFIISHHQTGYLLGSSESCESW